MGARKNLAVVERYFEITLGGDLDRLLEVVHKRIKGLDGDEKAFGLAALRAYFEGLRAGLSKPRFKADIVVCDEDWVSVCGKTSGIHTGALMGLPASGKKVSVPGSAFFRLKDGKISEIRSFWDVPAFLKQTALPPDAALALKRMP